MNPDSRYRVRKHDVGQRSIFVVDGLVDDQFIRMIHHFMRRSAFALSEYDTAETKHVQHWNHEFDPGDLQSVPIMPMLVSEVDRVTKDLFTKDQLILKRIHCNLHLYGDPQSPHTDLPSGVTALYYANPRWDTNWQGETLFYDDNDEPLYAVIPRPGRLVIFDADIVHRGGVPSRECFEPRLSVALKYLKV